MRSAAPGETLLEPATCPVYASRGMMILALSFKAAFFLQA
jgi:hypothetical protein